MKDNTHNKVGTFQSPRGTRDVYPEQMARRQWLFDLWRRISGRHGFEEYDGPIFEELELFRIKSGDEIVSQLFSFEDRGGRDLAIRPEITPTLARMIAAKAASLPRPMKWFSIPRLCRAERPQRGRLREFFQWNIDIVGSDSVVADAECMFVAVDMLRSVGLTAEQVELRVNSRTIIAALLEQIGIDRATHERAFAVMDKHERLEPDAFRTCATDQGLTDRQIDRIRDILAVQTLDEMASIVTSDAARREFDRLQELQEHLTRFGVADYFSFRPAVVRGLAYYTGVVFEIFDRASKLRAIAGGGRYDQLIEMFGGPSMAAVGFGMGDVILLELLNDLKKMPDTSLQEGPDFFVIDAADTLFDQVLNIVGRLRTSGRSAEFSYKRQSVSKQLKQANSRGAKAVVILGDETKKDNLVSVKTLATGSQKRIALEEFLSNPSI